MHDDEVIPDRDQVARLVAGRAPAFAGEPVWRVRESGTDHTLWRVGEHHVARMPRVAWAVDQAHQDLRWLPYLAPHLPLEVPEPVALGEPGEGFPWPWLLVRWIEGECPDVGPDPANVDLVRAAEDLADFVRALHAVDGTGGPPKTGTTRGVPLERLAAEVPRAIADAASFADPRRARAVWDAALLAGPWTGDPVWIHGDLQHGNLLVRERRLVAAIDFGALGVADPAPDHVPAWAVFSGESRRVFRERSGVDDATWARARAWAMLPALTGAVYYRDRWPAFAAEGRRRLAEILADPP